MENKKRNNRFIIIIISLLLIITLMLGVGCSGFLNYSSNQNTNSLNNAYTLNVADIDDYTNIDIDDIGVVVSSLVMPATVEIECKITYSYTKTQIGPGFGSYNQTIKSQATSLATGFFINEDGYLITNAHVVTLSDYESLKDFSYESWDILVNYADSNTTFEATIIDYNTDLDLAILKVDISNITNFTYVTFYNLTSPQNEEYNSDEAVKLLYGEVAIAIGNANGYGISVTQGVVSAPIRYFEDNGVITQAIQTDAAINSGNSGGPLVNKFGSVIGVNSFKIVTSTSESLGYAIPSNIVLEYIDSLDKDIKYYYTNEREYSKTNILTNIN